MNKNNLCKCDENTEFKKAGITQIARFRICNFPRIERAKERTLYI